MEKNNLPVSYIKPQSTNKDPGSPWPMWGCRQARTPPRWGVLSLRYASHFSLQRASHAASGFVLVVTLAVGRLAWRYSPVF